MGEPRPVVVVPPPTDKTGDRSILDSSASVLDSTLKQAQQASTQIGKSVRKAMQGDGSITVSASAASSPVVTMPSSQSRPAGFHSPRPAAAPLPGGSLALGVAGAALAWFFLGERVGRLFAGGSQGKGKWVRDRSMGGKMIFIPDQDEALEGAALLRPMDDLPDSPPATTRQALKGIAPMASASGPTPPAIPPWWPHAPELGYVSPKLAADNKQRALQVLRLMEDAKVARGLDYPLTGVLALVELCTEVGAVVPARTVAGQEAIYKSGLVAALGAAGQGRVSSLGGMQPPEFVAALARSLGMAEPRAVQIARAEVAAEMRRCLLSAAARVRGGNEESAMEEMAALASVVRTFRPSAGEAELELLGLGLRKKATDAERRTLVELFRDAADAESVEVVQQCLGV